MFNKIDLKTINYCSEYDENVSSVPSEAFAILFILYLPLLVPCLTGSRRSLNIPCKIWPNRISAPNRYQRHGLEILRRKESLWF